METRMIFEETDARGGQQMAHLHNYLMTMFYCLMKSFLILVFYILPIYMSLLCYS